LKSVELGSKYTLVKFDDYWKGWQKNQIDRIEVEIIAEYATRILKFKKGEIDLTDDYLLADPKTRDELAAMKGVSVYEDVQLRLALLQMNNKKPPLDDVNVRKAISYAFDYNSIVKDVFKGACKRRGLCPF